jgi:hypothetical protein
LAALIVLLSACGSGTTRTPAALPGVVSSTSVKGGSGLSGLSQASASELRRITITETDLGPGWQDLGEQPTSSDLTHPPASCARFAQVFETRNATLIHEFSYLLTDSGYESGHLNSTVIGVSEPNATRELQLIQGSSFQSCAQDTAGRFLGAIEQPVSVRSTTAHPLQLNLPVAAVAWRVAIDRGQPTSPAVFYMDIVYMAHGPYLEKIRVARCSCSVAPMPSAGVDPGEMTALNAVAARLAAAP